MNALQTMMQTAFAQALDVIQEAFTVVNESPAVIRYGTFGDPQIIPLLTRQGYEDHLVYPLKVAKTAFASEAVAMGLARGRIVRTQTGRTLFVQVVDYTEAVIVTFLLTDREL